MLTRHVRSLSSMVGVQRLALSRFPGCAIRCGNQLTPSNNIVRQQSSTATDEKQTMAPISLKKKDKSELEAMASCIKPAEGHSKPGYLATIQYFADAQQLDTAMEWVEKAAQANIQVRARHYLPIIEALVRDENLPKLIELVNHMLSLRKEITQESFAPLLNLLGKPKVREELQKHIELREAVHMLFTRVSDDLFGLLAGKLYNVVVHNSHIDAQAVAEQGVLVSTLEDIVAPVVGKEMLSTTGSLLAMNTAFNTTATENNNPSVQQRIQEGESTITMVKEKYLIVSAMGRIKAATIKNVIAGPQKKWLDVFKQQQFTHNAARIVDISRTTCRCPNCDGLVQSFSLTEEERKAVMEELHKVVQKHCEGDVDPLVEFSEVLRQGQYEYVVDGANVGQLDLLVEVLKKRSSSILVILPYSYKSTRVLNKLRAENMLYVTPPSVDDDWFLIYSTLYEGRQGPVQVVTNDFMRDHKVLFADQKAFMRWHGAHVAFFNISRKRQQKKLKHKQAVVERDAKRGDSAVKVLIQEPSKFTREMQRSTVGDYWHIPALDRNVWLCLNTAAAPSAPQSNVQEAAGL